MLSAQTHSPGCTELKQCGRSKFQAARRKMWDESPKRWPIMAVTLVLLAILTPILFGCIRERAPADITPPSLEVVNLTDGASVQGHVTLMVRASDDTDLSTVQYWVDDTDRVSMTSSDETDLYEAVIDTTTLRSGVHYFTVGAIDGGGNDSQITVRVNVDNPPSLIADPTEKKLNSPPSLKIIRPTGERVLEGMTLLQVETSDNQGSLVVEYSVDGRNFEPMGLDRTTGYHDALIDTTALSAGKHTITVRASDGAGQIAQAQIIKFVDNDAPVVTIVDSFAGSGSDGQLDRVPEHSRRGGVLGARGRRRESGASGRARCASPGSRH